MCRGPEVREERTGQGGDKGLEEAGEVTWVPRKSLVRCVKMCRHSQWWQKALKEYHSQAEVWRAHRSSQEVHRARVELIGDTGASQTRDGG